MKAFRLPRLDLELFKAPGLDFAAIWASSAWFGTTCGTSQGSIWSHLDLQGLICEPFGFDLEPFGPPGIDLEPFGPPELDLEPFGPSRA